MYKTINTQEIHFVQSRTSSLCGVHHDRYNDVLVMSNIHPVLHGGLAGFKTIPQAIRDCAVHRGHEGRGAGTLLMAVACQLIIGPHATKLYLC